MIVNNENFLLKEIPNYHPIAQKFDRLGFWKEEKRKCIEGFWSGGKWMPPELYYYCNFHTIIFEEGANRTIGRPWLRDIDWEQAYLYTEACGFSGFELDTEYTCHRHYGPEQDRAIKFGWLTEDEANSKKYIPTRDYLRKNHGKSLGKAIYLNSAKNIIELASRGYGKSYGASGRIAHNFLFDGARDYDLYLEKRNGDKPYTSETVVGAIDAKYSNDLLEKVKVGMKYLPGEASIKIGNDTEFFPSPLAINFTGSIAPGRNYVSVNSESKLYHRTFADNPFAANGTRPNRVFIDEVGFMNNLLETWGAVEATQAAAEFRRLCMYGMGTGGLTTGGAALYAQEIFYNPEQYDCIAFEDTWEDKGKICYFVPATKALNMFKEGPNKISNEGKALEYILEERAAAKSATSSTKYQATIINKPIAPSEIFLRMEGTFFPTADLNSVLADLEGSGTTLNATYKIRFNLIDGKPAIAVSDEHPIREFPLRRGRNMDACTELFELPKTDSNGRVQFGRYIAGWDPINTDDNSDVQQSLQSVFVLDSWTNRIVAEYTARTYLVNDFYEQTRRLLIFYNAVCLYESNVKGPYGYFKNKNSLHHLAETPEILKDQNLVKGSTVGNKSLGVATNDKVNAYGLGLILGWMEDQAYDRDEGIRNLDLIESPALIKELVSYSADINTDRVSALAMVMILKEDRARATDILLNKRVKTKSSDPFFDRAFKTDYMSSYLRKVYKNSH